MSNGERQLSEQFTLASITADTHEQAVDLDALANLVTSAPNTQARHDLDNFNRNFEVATTLYDFESIWESYQGQGTKVAILDTGIDTDHPAFPAGSIVRSVRINGGEFRVGPAHVKDTNGHGTHCAGIIAARPLIYQGDKEGAKWIACAPRVRTDAPAPAEKQPQSARRMRLQEATQRNSGCGKRQLNWVRHLKPDERLDCSKSDDNLAYSQLSVRFGGVAPSAELMIYKITHEEEGEDRGVAWIGDMAFAINDAVDNGAEIISISIQAVDDSDQLFHAVHRALSLRRIVVCSAGNRGSLHSINIGYPARYGGVITVAGHNRFGQPAAFTSTGGEVDISGPGEEVWSTWNGKSYARRSGTSMAAPWVAGIAALILSKHRVHAKDEEQETPVRNNEEMREHLIRMAAHKGLFRPEDGYGALAPGDYFGRSSMAGN